MSLSHEPPPPAGESGPALSRAWPLLLLAAIYIGGVVAQQPSAWFGHYHDDTLYLVSAQALARDGAYTLPSVPGEPAQTKYPVLYPALLAIGLGLAGDAEVVSAGVAAGVTVNILAGLLLLYSAWRLAAQLGLGRIQRLVVTGCIALHPVVVHLSAQILSETVFAALLVTGLVRAHDDLSAARKRVPWLSALLLALAVASRTAGLAGVGGMAIAAWMRGRRHTALAWVLATGAIFVGHQAWSLSAGWRPEPGDSAGWVQTMSFYTSYVRFWFLSVSDLPTFLAQLQFNVSEALKAPAVLIFHMPIQGFEGSWLQALGVMLSLGAVKGLWPVWKVSRHPAISGFLMYWPVVLVWNFPLAERLLLPWLAVLLCGAVLEISAAVSAATSAFRERRPVPDRVASALILAALAVLVGYSLRWSWSRHDALWAAAAAKSRQQEAREAVWERLRTELAADSIVISYDDAELFLRTGRRAVRPIAFRTSAFYLQSEAVLAEDLERLGDVARATGANAWLTLPADFRLETGRDEIVASTAEWLRDHATALDAVPPPAALHGLASGSTGVAARWR